MDKETRDFVIIIAVAVLALIGADVAVSQASGVDPPFTVVESQSMQHSGESAIGTIDTGDMVLVRSPDKTRITTYVEGYADGYRSFGEYGDVIIYERPGNDPVIHRAILYLESNHDGTWAAPSLKNYTDSSGNPLWHCATEDTDRLYGTLILTHVGYGDQTIYVDMSGLSVDKSGYLTKGDNAATNKNFDQSSGVYGDIVERDDLRSVAWVEIPWLGALKLFATGNTEALDKWAPNSLGCLFTTLAVIVVACLGLGYLFDEVSVIRARNWAAANGIRPRR